MLFSDEGSFFVRLLVVNDKICRLESFLKLFGMVFVNVFCFVLNIYKLESFEIFFGMFF